MPGWIKYLLAAGPTLAFAGDMPPLDENGWFLNGGDCPFECCVYREWHVNRDTPILNKPFGTEEVGIARRGETVDAKTGIVYSKPILFEVIKEPGADDNIAPLGRGDQFYLLAYAGEGFISAWHRGKIFDFDAFTLIGRVEGPFDPCDPDQASCWWRVTPGSNLENDWWAKVALPDGIEGWARPENFGNIDACG